MDRQLVLIKISGESMQSIKKHFIVFSSLVIAMFAGDICAAQRPVVGPFANAARYESMPMMARPYRIGHVYGNTMRRRYDRSMSTNYAAPVARASYMMNMAPSAVRMNAPIPAMAPIVRPYGY